MNDDARRQLLQSAYETTDRAVGAALAEVGSVKDLMEVTGAAMGHLEQTLEGIRRSADVKLDCRKGCSFCCWLNVDVRAHEVFLIVRWLRARWTAAEMAALETAARASRDAALGLAADAKAAPRPCVFLRDSVCSIYEVRPAACRRYHSISVNACAELFEKGDTEAQILHPLLEDAGRCAARGVHHPFVRAGFDAYYYDLPSALAEALSDPSCEERWLEGQKAFSSPAESKSPPGYSQDAAVSDLKASLNRGER